MKTSLTRCLTALAVAGLLGASSAQGADRLAALQASFKARYADLLALKRDGKVGETAEGTVAAVRAAYLKDAKVKAVVDTENKDRAELYAILARKEKTTAEVVAKRNAVRNAQKASVGEYLRDSKGNWKKKAK